MIKISPYFNRATVAMIMLACALASVIYLRSSHASAHAQLITPQVVVGMQIVGPDNDPNPVVNEGNNIKLALVDAGGQPIAGASFESDSNDIADVDAASGMLTGKQQGYATITARIG